MKKIFLVFGLLLAIVVFVFIYQKGKYNNMFAFSKNIASVKGSSITIRNQTFSLLLAKTDHEKELGLGGRDSIPQDEGMYFPFITPGFYSFWMKGMKFPLDIIYFKGNQITTIYNNLQNPSLQNDTWQIVQPVSASDGVLEVNAGLAKKYNFQIGDVAQLSL